MPVTPALIYLPILKRPRPIFGPKSVPQPPNGNPGIVPPWMRPKGFHSQSASLSGPRCGAASGVPINPGAATNSHTTPPVVLQPTLPLPTRPNGTPDA